MVHGAILCVFPAETAQALEAKKTAEAAVVEGQKSLGSGTDAAPTPASDSDGGDKTLSIWNRFFENALSSSNLIDDTAPQPTAGEPVPSQACRVSHRPPQMSRNGQIP